MLEEVNTSLIFKSLSILYSQISKAIRLLNKKRETISNSSYSHLMDITLGYNCGTQKERLT
jgi:hypothetical protein